MKIKELWVSSKKHHGEFNKILKQNSWIRKALGLYKMPSDFPFIGVVLQKFPIIYNKRYSLEINEEGLRLTPNNKYGFFNVAKNVNLEVNQSILINEIISITRYENPEPFMKRFNINWIQIKYYDNKKEEEMLFCVGGKLMRSIVRETNKVFDIIEDRFVKA